HDHQTHHKAHKEHQGHGGEDQAEAAIAGRQLPRLHWRRCRAVGVRRAGGLRGGWVCHGLVSHVQATTRDAVASSLGGTSKVWKGAGEGTSHSSPTAPSQGLAGAGRPLPRMAGIKTTNTK